MPTTLTPELLREKIHTGHIVPYLGPGALAGSVDSASGEPIPADSESLILAMNNGTPMHRKLMWEFPRAAMHVELKRGRKTVQKFLDQTYGERQWTRSPVHDWLAGIKPPYVIDTNRDLQLQASYADTPHTLIRGIARVGGTDYRFLLHHFDGARYREITPEEMDPSLPMLFKPMGSPLPTSTYIASDADYVDYLTELMGGFSIPAPLKQYRQDRQYLLIGVSLKRDTERMLVSDLTYGAGTPTGWALLDEPNAKERRYCANKGIQILEDMSLADLCGLPEVSSEAVALAGTP